MSSLIPIPISIPIPKLEEICKRVVQKNYLEESVVLFQKWNVLDSLNDKISKLHEKHYVKLLTIIPPVNYTGIVEYKNNREIVVINYYNQYNYIICEVFNNFTSLHQYLEENPDQLDELFIQMGINIETCYFHNYSEDRLINYCRLGYDKNYYPISYRYLYKFLVECWSYYKTQTAMSSPIYFYYPNLVTMLVTLLKKMYNTQVFKNFIQSKYINWSIIPDYINRKEFGNLVLQFIKIEKEKEWTDPYHIYYLGDERIYKTNLYNKKFNQKYGKINTFCKLVFDSNIQKFNLKTNLTWEQIDI